jgi:hypothetical protein
LRKFSTQPLHHRSILLDQSQTSRTISEALRQGAKTGADFQHMIRWLDVELISNPAG